MNLVDRLKQVDGISVLTEKEDMVPYKRDASYFTGETPDAVVIPENPAGVSEVMKICNELKVHVTVRSGGTSLTGASVPAEGGVVISMARMNRVLEVKPSDSYVIAEPGVRLDDLNRVLGKAGFFYPPDPASSMAATVGGTISTNAGGLRAATYGTTKEWILGLQVVMPTGEIIETGGLTLKRSKGYDLTALMAGSEGTLGIITRAVLKIWPLPEATGRIMAYFTEIAPAGSAIAELKSKGIVPYIAEFLDRLSLDSIRTARGIQFPEEANYLLLVDVASTNESLHRVLELAAGIIRTFNPLSLVTTTDREEMDRMYEARKGLYSSSLIQRDTPGEYVVIADVVVPASGLPETLEGIRAAAAEFRLKVVLFGHIGDGNIHANIFADLSVEDIRKNVDGFQMSIARIAVAHGGSVSAEHGIGLEKKELLRMELEERKSSYDLDMMRRIKSVFDPNNILNRGKIFD
ncbi:MAG: dehydrogenase [Thermoplasmatales archaeon B_DKE]|nr:MAG: dehydrogenase [Thermoplasmatales archaeon B_DKE]